MVDPVAVSDGTTITLTLGGLGVLATFVAGYATLRAAVADQGRRLAAAERTVLRLVRWRERTIGAAAARREESDVHRTLTHARIANDDDAADSEGDE